MSIVLWLGLVSFQMQPVMAAEATTECDSQLPEVSLQNQDMAALQQLLEALQQQLSCLQTAVADSDQRLQERQQAVQQLEKRLREQVGPTVAD